MKNPHTGTSLQLWETLAPPLQRVSLKAYELGYAHRIIQGWRSPQEQLRLFNAGKSKLKFGAHNYKNGGVPASRAFDWIPADFHGWNDVSQFRTGAHLFFAAGHLLETLLTWGGDWDNDTIETDQHFMDYDHIELRNFEHLTPQQLL